MTSPEPGRHRLEPETQTFTRTFAPPPMGGATSSTDWEARNGTPFQFARPPLVDSWQPTESIPVRQDPPATIGAPGGSQRAGEWSWYREPLYRKWWVWVIGLVALMIVVGLLHSILVGNGSASSPVDSGTSATCAPVQSGG